MILTAEEIRLILELLAEKYGHYGYADDEEVARLQAKLSMMLEAKSKTADLRKTLSDLDK